MEEIIYSLGDILWCERLGQEEIEEENHKTGPFIFIKADKDYFYAVKGSGFIWKIR